MNKSFGISVMSLAFTVSLSANETQGIDIGNYWKALGDIRVGYVHYDYNNPPPGSATINKGHTDSHGFYTTPKVSILSPKYNNFSAKATVGGATDFGLNDPAYESRNFVFDSAQRKPFILLQELFISYVDKSHNLSIGRQEIVTPLIEADDYYMLANSFEVANYTNSVIDDIKFHFGYFHKMAGVWDSGANGTEFHSMSDTSYVDTRDKANANDSGGIVYGAVEYKNKSHNFKVWEYYATDLYNILLGQYDYSSDINSFSYELGVQLVNYKEVGKLETSNFTNIDYTIYSAKFDGKFSNGINFATGATKYSDGSGQSATLGAWGGFPSHTYGFAESYFGMGSLQNASIYKVQVGFDLEKVGLKNSWIGYRHVHYDLDPKYSKTATSASQDYMFLNGFKISYATKVGVYFKGIYEHRILDSEDDSSALRLIGGYRF